MHNAGRAADFDIASLKFSAVPAELQLDTLWNLALPIGWRPVLRDPKEKAPEAWHFDFWGCWQPVLDRLGYEQAAICAVLDVGMWGPFTAAPQRFLQAQLHRAGYNIGAIDGLVGPKTLSGARHAGIPAGPVAMMAELSTKLRDSERQKWPLPSASIPLGSM